MPQKPHKVIFLGAGASKDLDLPLTKEILPEVLRQLKKGSLFEGSIPGGSDSRRELRELFRTMLPGGSSGAPFITDLLSLVDHSILQTNAVAFDLKRLDPPGIAYQAPKNLMKLRTLLERSIYEVLKRKYPGLIGYDPERLSEEIQELL